MRMSTRKLQLGHFTRKGGAAVPLRSGTPQGCLLLSLLVHMNLEVRASGTVKKDIADV